jgi:peptide/nickel transport system substrate-binding protein
MKEKGKEKLIKVNRRTFLKTATTGLAVASTCGVFQILGRPASAASRCRVLMIPTAKLTPPTTNDGQAQSVLNMIYDWLVRLEGPDGKLTPSLAKSYSNNKDMTEWTFHLRDNVKFHHGTQLSADDVIYSAKRWADPKMGGGMRAMFSDLAEVTKVDNLTVVFKMKKPNPDFLLKLLEFNAAILAHDYDNDQLGDTKPSGSGPFMVKTLVPGQRIVMDKNPNYFIPGLPKVDQMEVIFIPEIQTQLMTLEAGQAEVVRWMGFDSVLRYQSNPKVQLHSIKTSTHGNFYMRADQPPFNDNRVRLAIKHCIDRPTILKSAVYGYGEIGNDSPVWPGSPLYTDIGLRERNIETAKKLLSDAGYPKGLDVDVYVSSNHPPMLDIVLAMQQMVAPAGVNLQIKGVSRDIYYGRYWLKVNCGITNWAHRESPLDLMRISLHSGASWNEGGYANPDFDKLLDEASVEMDQVIRKEKVKKIEELLSNEGPAVVPIFYNVFAATRKEVKGFQMVRTMSHDYRFIEVA